VSKRTVKQGKEDVLLRVYLYLKENRSAN